MVRYRLGAVGLARLRLARSPLLECVASRRVLRGDAEASAHAAPGGWAAEARAAVRRLDLGALDAFLPRRSAYIPDVLAPPESAQDSVHATIERVRGIAASVLEHERRRCSTLDGGRARCDPVIDADRLADTLHTYWDRALAPVWDACAAVLDADILRRARVLAADGAGAMLDTLHPSLALAGDTVELRKPARAEVDATRDGLVLVPSSFAVASRPLAYHESGTRPAIVYRAVGCASTLDWTGNAMRRPDELAQVVGRGAAAVLRGLGGAPATPTALARRAGVTVGAISQQLATLRRSGLVAAPSRVGKHAHYSLTSRGEALLHLFDASEATIPT